MPVRFQVKSRRPKRTPKMPNKLKRKNARPKRTRRKRKRRYAKFGSAVWVECAF